jgi:aspartyl-tRNA(Asn)/glutamyl-tRNA(Gln) amidotransferase subunit B
MGLETQPNKNICPVCTAQPGSLPVPNKKAIEYVIKAGLALNCRIAKKSKFDRKNYFYPDLPKGYQISQYDQPLCEKGFLEIALGKEKKRIGITRIHLEEDTGKSIHQKATGETLIDFNRAGVPLMELVTEPDIVSSLEAKKFCESLRSIFRYLGISSADMEKGQMRCEANISLYLPGKDPLSGTKVELKNINSFKAVEKGIEYEIRRQTEILEEGGHVIQETRGWNDSLGKTFPQRKKENSDDYRYFPEPDILPLSFSDREIEMIGKSLPELPLEKKDRLVRQYGLSEENAEIVVSSKDLAQYFEEVASELDHWMEVEEHEFDEQTKTKVYKLAVNYLLTEIQKHLFHKGLDIKDMKVTPENFAELIKIIYDGQINSSAAQVVLEEMFETGADPSRVIEEKDLVQSNDESELDAVVDGVLKKNQPSVDDYKKGKQNAIQYLMGQVMSETKGKANPQMVIKILKEKLDKIIEVEPQ